MSIAGLHALGLINALGDHPDVIARRMFAGDTGRHTLHHLKTTGFQVPAGRVHEELPPFPEHLAVYGCRNHILAYRAFLQIEDQVSQLINTYGAHRIGVVLGSSTAGLDATEEAYRIWRETGSLPQRYDYQKQHAMGSVAGVIAEAAGIKGPSYTLSTACTSSAKAMISARALLEMGFCDAVISGGVDTLCHMTLNGFEALGALSRDVCLPMSRNRSGLNIGEGAALFIMTRKRAGVNLVGAGESCDAHHMSAPHPEGIGAEMSMREALVDAGLTADQVHYLNLHGTATRQNDSMEALAVHRVFGDIPCASTKPLIGHCLGAAGAMEAAFCWLSLQQPGPAGYILPPHVYDGQVDPDLPSLDLALQGRSLAVDGPVRFMSNSFAFGGNNCTLVLEGGGQ